MPFQHAFIKLDCCFFSLGPPNPDTAPEDGKLKSEMIIKDNRRYYMDLKENARGRFLRVSIHEMFLFLLTL
jgi:hypothetical protein